MSGVRRVAVGGHSLAVEESGSGRPVVVLHGFTGDAASMSPAIRPLAHGFRTIAVELVGHGRSDRPADVAPYAMAACVEQLVSVLDALEVERASWLGYSMGGRAALAFAASHPERVERLLLVGASAGLADPEARRDRIASDEALADRIERDGIEAFVDHWMALPLFTSQQRLGAVALARAREQRLRNAPHGLANSLRGMGSGAQEPLHDRLAEIAVPVCLAVGDEDEKFDAIARDLAQRLPDARVACIPDSGHAAHLENPEAFARVAERFFAGEEPS